MELGLKGKVAIVAASSKGLGKAAALAFAREGAKVVICARGEGLLQQTAKDISSATGAEVLALRADVTRAEDIKRLVELTVDRFGRIDILVNNAGGPPSGSFLGFSDEDWEAALALNLLSTIRLSREVIPHMQRQGGGRIVNIVSIAAKEPVDGLILSNTARAAVIGLAKTLSTELGRDNILVNNVCPGWILTDRSRELLAKRAEAEKRAVDEVIREMEEGFALGRFGRPEEVANLILFLASERASYITGATIQVDGGAVKGLL